MRRFKLDENLPARAGDALRKAGHDVRTVLEQDLGGAADTVVFEACATESRVLVTLDLDFADIRRHGVSESPGIWIIEPHRVRVWRPDR